MWLLKISVMLVDICLKLVLEKLKKNPGKVVEFPHKKGVWTLTVLDVKMHKNGRERFYSSNKENLTCWDKRITANSRWKSSPKYKNNETDTSCTKCVVGLCYIFFYYFNTTELFVAFSKVNNQLLKF